MNYKPRTIWNSVKMNLKILLTRRKDMKISTKYRRESSVGSIIRRYNKCARRSPRKNRTFAFKLPLSREINIPLGAKNGNNPFSFLRLFSLFFSYKFLQSATKDFDTSFSFHVGDDKSLDWHVTLHVDE